MTTRTYNITLSLNTFTTMTTSVQASTEEQAVDQVLEQIQPSLSDNQEVSVTSIEREEPSFSGYTSIASLYNVTPPPLEETQVSSTPTVSGYTRLIN